MGTQRLDDYLKIPTDIDNAGKGSTSLAAATNYDSTVFADMRDHEQGVVIGIVTTHGGTDTITVTPLQATDAAGTGKKAIGSNTATISATAGSGATGVVAFSVGEMDVQGNFRYVGIRLAPSGATGHTGCGIVILGEPKYTP